MTQPYESLSKETWDSWDEFDCTDEMFSAFHSFFTWISLAHSKHQNPIQIWITKGILKSTDTLKFYDMVVYVGDCDAVYVLLFHNLVFVIFTTIIHKVFLYFLITLSGIVYLDHNKLTNKSYLKFPQTLYMIWCWWGLAPTQKILVGLKPYQSLWSRHHKQCWLGGGGLY